MTKNIYYNALINFINSNPNWKTDLKKPPYNLKTIKECPYNPSWTMFVYNLFDSDLQNPVVKACRGSVLEIKNNKVIRPICMPFTKFTNYGEFPDDDAKQDWNSSYVTQKIDGILIKMAKVATDDIIWMTNGSFDLDAELPNDYAPVVDEKETREAKTYGDLLKYALKKEDKEVSVLNEANSLFKTNCSNWQNKIPVGWTLTFELVSPRNRIICKYNETKLYFHGARDAEGIEHKPEEVAKEYKIPYETPQKFELNNIDDIKKFLSTFNGEKEEGVVIVDKSWHRIKIKSDSYLKLKFTKGEGNFSKKSLFKSVVDSDWDDIVGAFPTIKATINEIRKEIEEARKNFLKKSIIAKNEYEKLNFSKAAYADWVKSSKIGNIWFDFLKDNPENIFDKKLNAFSIKKKGYEDFLSFKEKLL